MVDFQGFPKIPRLTRDCIITEKIDGTNASILITEDDEFFIASRKRWITPDDDNYGFARWGYDNQAELMKMGVGHHFGEWWGQGIQRKYNMDKKVFSLFNVSRWHNPEDRPDCCSIVPILYCGLFTTDVVDSCLGQLKNNGSIASPGFMNPEGVVIYHKAANQMFKKTIEKDDEYKGVSNGK